MKIVLSIVVLALILVFGAYFLTFYKKPADIKTAKIEINGSILTAEIADTNALRAKGLSTRESMLQDYGMLFIFPASGNYSFWMKGMLFPLDFVWVNGETVVDLKENVALPGDVLSENWPSFSSRQPFDKALELNAGAIKSLGIKVGDRVKF